MSRDGAQQADRATGFFESLPALADEQETFDSTGFARAPDDWALIVTDIVDSTSAIAAGRHKTVNFVAAMVIAALKNLCAPERIPFLFGGDGAVVMVPPTHVRQAQLTLARVRGQAQREFGMALRMGLVSVAQLRRFDADVSVARYEPSAGNSFGVFIGGGVKLLEAAIRGKANPELRELASIAASLDDAEPVDLSGLSCRWNELRSKHGKMLTLIVDGAKDPSQLYSTVMSIAGQNADPRPVRLDTLKIKWPPTDLMLEVRARRLGGSLAKATLHVIADSLIARILFAIGRPVGAFDPDRYRREIVTNTDFCRHDETLCIVIDCPEDKIEPIKTYVSQQAQREPLRFGIHTSDTALMTCLVTSPTNNLHVHFVDGGGGGYTQAAKAMKA